MYLFYLWLFSIKYFPMIMHRLSVAVRHGRFRVGDSSQGTISQSQPAWMDTEWSDTEANEKDTDLFTS